MPNHKEYIENLDASVALLTETRDELDEIANDMLAPETDRAHADAVAVGITTKLGVLATERAAYMARHNSGIAKPSETAVARSFDIAADLGKVIAAANRPTRILNALTSLLNGLTALGAPPAGAAVAAKPAAVAGAAPLAAFAPKVAGAKGPVTTLANGVHVPAQKPDFQVKASDLDGEPAGSGLKPTGVAPLNKAGAKDGDKSTVPAKDK